MKKVAMTVVLGLETIIKGLLIGVKMGVIKSLSIKQRVLIKREEGIRRMHAKKTIFNKFVAALMAVTIVMPTVPAKQVTAAATSPISKLTVDMTNEKGDILHGAAGFLYGISSEDVPTTNTLVPLKPKVLATKGALGTEHPYGDALDVAETFLESGGEQVMMYNSNYYGVFGVTADYTDYSQVLKDTIAPHIYQWKQEWKEKHGTPSEPKDNIGKRIDIDKAIIYIPINEGTPNNGAEHFGVAWKSYYDAIKEGDPDATIAGTNDWFYNSAFGTYVNEAGETVSYNLDDFLPYCIENDCMPDIITWHELETKCLVEMEDHKADFVQKWETAWTNAGKEVPELPQICINEYATMEDCGVPGRLVNWIARLEDNEMYGCLPFWHQANDLNDLTSDANEGNAAWWAFKWYGDMSGRRLDVQSTTEYDELYGLATIDDNKQSAKVLFGGEDGSSTIVLNNVDETNTFKDAEKVHVKVEATNFVGLEGSQYNCPTVIEGTFPVNSDGSVIVNLKNMKFATAYCMTITKASEEEYVDDPVVSEYSNCYEAEDEEVSDNAAICNFWGGSNIGGAEHWGPNSYLSDNEAVLMKQGGKLTYTIQVPTDGKYELNLVYGNGTGTKRSDPENSLSLNLKQKMLIDGQDITTMTMKNTLLTNATGSHIEYVDLVAGTHTITVESLDEGEVLHDFLLVTWNGAVGKEQAAFDEMYEAEHADFNTLLENQVTTVSTQTELAGYSKDGYVTGLTKSVTNGGGIRWNVLVEESGLYNLELHYQSVSEGTANIYVGNTAITLDNIYKTVGIDNTEGNWRDVEVTVYLQKGINIVDVDATVDMALDYLNVSNTVKTTEVQELSTMIEAEDCIPEEATSLIQTVSSDGASKGIYVKGLEGDTNAKDTLGKYLEFTYNAPSDGQYMMQIFQSNDEICGEHGYNTKVIDKYASVSVADKNGNETSNARYFFINTNSQDSFREKTITLSLTAGKNTIRVYNDDSWQVLYGGTQTTPGDQQLDNYSPNFDRFIITPQSLENAIQQETQYGITIKTTAGGYATTDENIVSAGGSFNLTIAPETDLNTVVVDGVDMTNSVVKNDDGTYGLNIVNVHNDVLVNIRFTDVNSEYEDQYIKNAGFGTGNTLYWTTTNVEVEKDAVDGYDGFYASINQQSKIEQSITDIETGNYFFGVYSKGSDDATGIIKLIVTVNGIKTEKKLKVEQDYWETVLQCSLVKGQEVTVEIDTSELVQGTVYLDNFSVLPVPERDATTISRFTDYFVNCGDHNPSTITDGDKFGTRNSVTDQLYQVDSQTGYRWGVVTTDEDPAINPWNNSYGAWTKYQYPYEWDIQDNADKLDSWRHTLRQDGITTKYIRYMFELDPGTYDITVGLKAMWGDTSATSIIGNNTQLGEEVSVPLDPGTIEVTRELTIDDDEDTLDLQLVKENGNIWVTYIQITQAGDQGDLSDIKKLYNQLKDVKDDMEDPYSIGSWTAFTKALETVQEYAEMDSIARDQQDLVDNATNKLKEAYENLRKEADTIDYSLLYFVDCGDHGITTVSKDDKFGTWNTITDQVYAEDPSTGKNWGVIDPNGNTGGGSGIENDEAAYTSFTSAFTGNQVNNVVTDNLNKNNTYRYASNQLENGFDPRYVSYKFEVDGEGTYPVEVGLGNNWGNSANPVIYANYDTDSKVLLDDTLNIAQGLHKSVVGAVNAVDGYITIDVRSTDPTINVNFIKIGVKEGTEIQYPLRKLNVTPPSKMEYVVGEEFNPSGMVVEAVNSNNESNILSSDEYSVSGFDSSTAGTKVIVITYANNGITKSATFEIEVKEKEVELVEVTSIKVTQLPFKTEYKKGEQLDSSGLEVTAYYSDNTSALIQEYSLSGFTSNSTGVKTVTVSYEGKKTSFNVTVISNSTEPPKQDTEYSPVITKIDITKIPSKTIYQIGDELDPTGLEVTAYYSDGTSKKVQGYTISGFESGQAGTKTVVISYGDVKTEFVVTVVNQTYTIRYKLIGGKNNADNPLSYTTETITFKSPTRKGYTFVGWYKEAEGKNKVTSVSGEDITIYAKWKKVTVSKVKITTYKNVKENKLKLVFNKVSGAKGYEIRYSLNKSFTKEVKKLYVTKTSSTISNLKKDTTYYIKVRAYKIDSTGSKVYGAFSSIKKLKITK